MMRRNFDMDALRTIVVGTELGSFARAASRLGRSQSAVSMQLKKLEEQAGRALFRRNGRGLVPTEAGDALLAYARRIVALNDEAAASVGATAAAASVRLGLPQDFCGDVMAEAIRRFSRQRPGIHVEMRAGRNHALEEDVRAGRIDIAVAFYPVGSGSYGTRIASLPMLWLAAGDYSRPPSSDPLPLVLYDHPCLFRQAALQTLERKGLPWRLALTTPSLPGVWAAVRSGHGISVRTAYGIPTGVRDIGSSFGLPKLPPVELRSLFATEPSPAASDLKSILDDLVRKKVTQKTSRT